jgi:hypothetical protein
MKLKIIILAVVLVVIAGIFLLINRSTAPTTQNFEENQIITDDVTFEEDEIAPLEQNLPWIEVVSGVVNKKEGGVLAELKSGDQLKNGDIIKTDSSGLANIYMPDGSVARLDYNSEIVITQAHYFDESKSLQVKIKLVVGRIWSKIVELSTNESYWEVETANAVAAVRGTAFGMEYENDETLVIGWENTVEVEAVDLYSGRKSVKVAVSANKFFRISEAVSRTAVAEKQDLSQKVKDLPSDILSLPWIERAINADTALFGTTESIFEEDNSLEQSVEQTSDDSVELLDVSAPTLNLRY